MRGSDDQAWYVRGDHRKPPDLRLLPTDPLVKGDDSGDVELASQPATALTAWASVLAANSSRRRYVPQPHLPGVGPGQAAWRPARCPRPVHRQHGLSACCNASMTGSPGRCPIGSAVGEHNQQRLRLPLPLAIAHEHIVGGDESRGQGCAPASAQISQALLGAFDAASRRQHHCRGVAESSPCQPDRAF